ncbi:MAG: condensation domain-containing protein [Vicinamibacterales bacterium]
MSTTTYRVSHVQRRFLDAPRMIAVHTCWDVDAVVDATVMARAVSWLATRQAMLRTVFTRDEDGWLAHVGPATTGHVDVVDATTWSRDEIQDHLEASTAIPFDRAARAPFVVRLYRMRGGRTIFFPLLDHVLADGWSLQTIVTELWSTYAALAAGTEPDLPPLVRSYADYAAAEAALVDDEAGRRQLAFWERRLAGVPALDPPTDHPRVTPRAWRGGSVPFRLEPAAWQAVRDVAPALGTTPFVFLLAAYVAAVARWSGRPAFAVGTSSAGRWSETVRHVIGPYVNPVAVPADLRVARTGRTLVKDVQARLIEALAHRDLPFGVIVDRLAPAASSRPPFFETMFIMLNVFDIDRFRRHLAASLGVPLDGVRLWHPVPNRHCRYDFEVLTYEYDGALHGALDFDCDLYDRSTMAALASDYVALVSRLAAAPDETLAGLPGTPA